VDLAELVDYEFLYPLELCHPTTGEALGTVFRIRSAGSEAAKQVLRQHTDKHLERRIKGRVIKSDQIEREELERAASYISSWDWGDNTYEGAVPDFSMKTAIEIMEKWGWIFAQVTEAATKLENFSPASRKPSSPS